MNSNITTLINKKKWNKIVKLLQEGKIDVEENVVNDNNIVHFAALNDISPIIIYTLNKNFFSILKSNKDGYSPLHIM